MVAGYVPAALAVVRAVWRAWAIAGMRNPARLTQLGRKLRLPRFTEWGDALVLPALLRRRACLYGVPNSLRELHPTRVGFREAGLWIAAHADPADEVLDPFCWARFYAGRELAETAPPPPAPGRLTYVVLDNIYSFDHHSHLPALEIAKREATGYATVFHWPANVDAAQALVYVYAVPWKPLVLPRQ